MIACDQTSPTLYIKGRVATRNTRKEPGFPLLVSRSRIITIWNRITHTHCQSGSGVYGPQDGSTHLSVGSWRGSTHPCVGSCSGSTRHFLPSVGSCCGSTRPSVGSWRGLHATFYISCFEEAVVLGDCAWCQGRRSQITTRNRRDISLNTRWSHESSPGLSELGRE